MRYHATRPPARRMSSIDQQLRTSRWPSKKELARTLEVSGRTIGRDIEYMRLQHNAPIVFDRRRGGYYYREPSYRLPALSVTQGEVLALCLSERMLRQFRGTPFEGDLRHAIDKLSEALPNGVTVRLDAIADFLSVLPSTEVEYDPDAFGTLLRAVVGRRRLDLRYWSASRDQKTRRDFDPYDLSLVADGWYAIGHCHLRSAVRMFAVQRIVSVRETGETFDRPADFRVDDYLRGSFRAVRGDGEYRVVLRFHATAARRFSEKRWHKSQVLEPQRDGSLIARMELNSLIEVKRWIMWWGTDCEVLDPPELRELVAAEAAEVLSRAQASQASTSASVRVTVPDRDGSIGAERSRGSRTARRTPGAREQR
jgi:predicted DNA-binding transcriptional regulator YafY